MNTLKWILLVTQLTMCCGVTNLYSQRLREVPKYFNEKSKVGLMVLTRIEYDQNSGSGGLGLVGGAIGAAMSGRSSSKYDSALSAVEPEVNPTQDVVKLYSGIYSARGKQVVLIEDKFRDEDLNNFKPVKGSKVKFFEKDLRFLAEKYQIDEVLIVSVVYGLRSVVSYGIEQHRHAVASLTSVIVNVKDNSILLHELTGSWNEKVDKTWNSPPAYEYLKKKIKAALGVAMSREWEKYRSIGAKGQGMVSGK